MLELNFQKKMEGFFLDIHMHVANEALAILGASGSGKSMTLKCIAGIEKPDHGTILLDGKTVFDADKKIDVSVQKRNVGYLFQTYALFPQKTVQQNVMLGMYALPLSKQKKLEKASEMLTRFHLSGFEKRFPHQLSGGQQQRIAIARMLVSKPRILMLDEPFSALDSHLRWEMEQVVAQVMKEHGGTTLFVSHNRDEAFRLCDQIAVIDEGRISVQDEKHALFQNPRKEVAARLTGCKNCATVQKTGTYTMYVPDWNLHLEAARPLEKQTKVVGLRAHYFFEGKGENVFSGRIEQRIECPFSTIYMVRPMGATKCLRWESSAKSIWKTGDVLQLCIAKDQVLLLE